MGDRPTVDRGHSPLTEVAQDLVDGIERATFGAVPVAVVDDWLHRHVRARLGSDLEEVVFRPGRVSAVYGLRLSDGSQVVAKVQRGHLDPARTASLAAAVNAQRLLSVAGYPCPSPLDGPATTDGLTATMETLLDTGAPGDGHDGATRTAIATSLAQQVQLLATLPESARAALRDPPAWALDQQGPWPPAHDPIFDFTTTAAEHAWLDELAARAAGVLTGPEARRGPRVVGHSDWYCGNLRFSSTSSPPTRTGGTLGAARVQVVAVWDWDSLVHEIEPVIAGMAAASFTDGSTNGAQCPAPDEAAAFLAAYDDCRPQTFSEAEQASAAAAVTWTLAYNARCQIDVLAMGYRLPEGPVLHALAAAPDRYIHLRW